VKRIAARGHELTIVGCVVALIVAIMAAGIAATTIGLNTNDTVSAVLYLAIATGVGVAVALGLDRARGPIYTRSPASAIPMLGPGLQET
jgi:hypothetical protein